MRVLRAVGIDVVAVTVTFAVLGAVGGWLWFHQVHLPAYQRTAQGVVLDQLQLSRLVSIDGWYAVIALAGGVIAGFVLTWARGREPLVIVLLLVAGGALAAWVMLRVGAHLAPPVSRSALEHLPRGGRAPVPLAPHAKGVEYLWPIAALLGAIAVLLGGREAAQPRQAPDGSSQPG